MNRACFASGIAWASGPCTERMPALAKKNRATPASRAPQAIDSNRIVIGWYRSLTFSEGREPILAEAASKIPSPHPTHPGG
jgi:hypothetical protein